MKTTPYQMCVNNAATHIRKHPALDDDNIDILKFSSVMSVLFCKDKAEILADILKAHEVAEKV